jgi:hypothetical protein
VQRLEGPETDLGSVTSHFKVQNMCVLGFFNWYFSLFETLKFCKTGDSPQSPAHVNLVSLPVGADALLGISVAFLCAED